MSVEKSESKLKETCKFSREQQKKMFNRIVGNFSVEPVIIQTLKNK
jgi:GTP1/Obg family GTP-binding protein